MSHPNDLQYRVVHALRRIPKGDPEKQAAARDQLEAFRRRAILANAGPGNRAEREAAIRRHRLDLLHRLEQLAEGGVRCDR